MNYSDLNLKVNTDYRTISIQPGKDINILNYVSIADKNDIVHIAIQNSEENGIYNLFKLRMYFNLYIVYLYTNLEFTQEEKDDPVKLYDELCSNGIMYAILNSMNADEFSYLNDVLDETVNIKMEYRNTLASVLNSFIENLPANASRAAEIIDKFKPEDFQRVIQFAQAANGNRPIN